MDWELHGLPYINLFASLACDRKDALAAHLENNYLQYMRAWQVTQHGDLAVAGSRLGFTRHAICAEQATFGFLAHKIFGPPTQELTTREAALAVEGTHARDWIQVITHRTDNKFASFSWTNRLMGMLIPIGPGHERNPDFIVPMLNGFIGSFDLIPKGDTKTIVVEHTWEKTANGFETTGTLHLNGGRLQQTLRMISIGEKTVVDEDRVTALRDVTVAAERGMPLGIENDEVTGDQRVVTYQDGKTVFDRRNPQHPVAISGAWANVDGRLGIVAVVGSGITYNQATGYAPGISVCTDVLYGSFLHQDRHFKAGEEVARRITIAFVEVSPRQTAALARSVKIEGHAPHQKLHFKLPEGGEAEIALSL